MQSVLEYLTPLVDAGIGVIAISLYSKLSRAFEAFEKTQKIVIEKLEHVDRRLIILEAR